MKKIFTLSFLAALLAVSSAHAQESSIITHTAGHPVVIRGAETLPATEGMICQTGDVLKTPTSACQIDLSLNNLAGCRVLPGSECSINNGSKEDMKFQIKSGNAILNLEKLPADSAFQVETPTAIAAVRGTQFWGRVDLQDLSNPLTTFAVREGSVEITAKNVGQKFLIRQGEALDIPTDPSKAPSIRAALAGELLAMEQASSIKTSA